MKITYLGHSSFVIETEDNTILTDPYNPETLDMKWKDQEADIVCVSHQHDDHNYVEGVNGDPFVISVPGEYEVGGVQIQGLPSYHDDDQGKERGSNTVFLFESEGIYVAHFGDIGHPLEEEQQERLGVVDILMIPVSGIFTINAEQATNMVAQIEPRVVIPMHYNREGTKTEEWEFAAVEEFLKEMGAEDLEPQNQFKASSASSLPDETEVVWLKPLLS